MLAAIRCRPKIARVAQPLAILSRGELILNNTFNANATNAIGSEQPFFNPQDSFWYLPYHGVGTADVYGLAKASTRNGPWTDVGAMNMPALSSKTPQHLLLGPDNKWTLYGGTSAGSEVVSIYQTTAAAAINSAYSLVSSPLALGATTDAGRIAEPFVFVGQDGIWRMLYMGFNAGFSLEQVHLATSSGDHTGPWTKYASNPIIPNGPGTFDAGCCADPFCYYYAGTYYIFYSPGVVNAPAGDNPLYLACVTTTDWVTFTKRGIVFPPGLAPSAPDCVTAWAGGMAWDGLNAGDNTYVIPTSVNTLDYFYYGRNTSSQNTITTRCYRAKLDAQSIFGGAISGNPWTRVETSGMASAGVWTNTTSSRGYSHGDLSFSTATGATRSYTFTGKRVRIFFAEASSFGIANISMDGVQVATFDSFIATTEALACPVIGYDSGDMMHGSHTVVVTVTGTKNVSSSGVEVSLDCLEYI